jgi:regulation of enolase protein 1 (concanavalin A-like superfamily)
MRPVDADSEFRWLNEPPYWEKRGAVLVVTTGAKTDFWNNTFCGDKNTNGHFYGRPTVGDFSAEAEFSAAYQALYDQAGLMLRVDDETWLKTGIELTDGALHFSVVVTRGDQSDWSMMPHAADPAEPVAVRLTRYDEALCVQVMDDGVWRLVRQAYLPMPETVDVGPMCCSPTGEGLQVTFHRFDLGPPISRDLHADT